mgnify:CR=1 FL=1
MKKILLIRLFLSFLIIGCYAVMYYQPMWSFEFIAPQYPQGLELEVLLTGARGDVFEIDIINHYIGMSKLADAAVNERAFAPYALMGLSLLAVLIALVPNKWFGRIMALPIIGFPMAFVGIFFMWLYKFGHDLDPAAPVDLTPFTPTILGTGIIGQFKTFAIPEVGFYLACFAAICAVAMLCPHLALAKSEKKKNCFTFSGPACLKQKT